MITLTGKAALNSANHNEVSQTEFTPSLAVSKNSSLHQSPAKLKANPPAQPARKLAARFSPRFQGSKKARVLFLVEEGLDRARV